MTITVDGNQETPEEMFPRDNALGAAPEVAPPSAKIGATKADPDPEIPRAEPNARKKGARETWDEYSGKAYGMVKAQPYAVAAGVAGAGFLIGLAIAKKMRRRDLPL